MESLRARQVHLDFHTSEHIRDVGADFDESQFQSALTLGRVNSITLFAKCHHSWSYYPTEVGRRHPNLATDLLGRQIQAAHAIGVRCPIYYTVGWSENDAINHPEWCIRREDGSIESHGFDPASPPDAPRELNVWINLCPSGGYANLIAEQTREICRRFAVDGLFYDICNTRPCWCDRCRAGMQATGLDAGGWAVEKWLRLMRRCNAIIHESHRQASIFWNGLAQPTTPPELLALQTHYELEDLPTTWGGYDKFPPRAKFFARHNKPLVAMSGKFHTSWGEFGGFKAPQAVRAEAAAMIAFGAGCSFGDQLHPTGRMDESTYRLIGHAYEYVERIEEFGLGGEPFATLGLVRSNDGAGSELIGQAPGAHDQGVANMLMEGQIDFEIADLNGELGRYDTLVLTGAATLDERSAQHLHTFLGQGGSVVALGESVLSRDHATQLLDTGSRYAGPPRFKVDYLLPSDVLADDWVRSPVLCDLPAHRFEPTDGQILAQIHEPSFDRTIARFCSHRNTPNQPTPARHAGATQKGRLIHIAHPLGAIYYHYGPRIHRDVFLRAVRSLHTRPAATASLPSAGRVNVIHQPSHRRYVVHLLYQPPLQRGQCLVLEDLPVLHDVRVSLRVPQAIREVILPVTGERLARASDSDAVTVVVGRMQSHATVVFEY